ncbi:MAG: hypothetical protein Kow0069_05720 [Promethearchaeota archaeon]
MRPKFKLLDAELAKGVVEEALDVLERVGVMVESADALELLREAGTLVDDDGRRVLFPRDLVRRAVRDAPGSVVLHDVAGREAAKLEGDRVHFCPGSAALNVLDGDTGEIRAATSKDASAFNRVVEQLEHVALNSTAIVCSDLPEACADRYRLFLCLTLCSKPVVTGTFNAASFPVMLEMLHVVRGSPEALRDKPLAAFDACPSPPLQWSDLTCRAVVDCARAGVPSELVSMPMTGATAPVTPFDALVQHAAENLSGVAISQLASRGAPVIWGGSPSAFDLRFGTTPMGSMDTMLLDLAVVEVGKHLGLPTHAYLGLSDAKVLDAQAGLESGAGTLLAGLAGVNVVSGAGMLEFERTQSPEKLVLDDQVCGMVLKFLEGVRPRSDAEPGAVELLADFCLGGRAPLSHPHTRRWYRSAAFYPGPVVDRLSLAEWRAAGRKDAAARAREEVAKLLSSYEGPPLESLDPEAARRLKALAREDLANFGVDGLPGL